MTEASTANLIDLVARELGEHLSAEAADAIATQVVGQLQSRFVLIPRVPENEEAETRAQLDALAIPGLFPLRGRASS